MNHCHSKHFRRPGALLRAVAYCAFFALCLPAHADSWQAGIDAYQNGEYDAAIDDFQQSVESEETPAARHNLALSYFKLGQQAEAVWQLERAIRLAPFNKDYRRKLGTLREQLGLVDNTSEWFELAAQALPFKGWALLAATGFWLLLAALVLPRVSGTRAGIGIKATRLLCGLIFLLALPTLWVDCRVQKNGVVVSKEVADLHVAPATAAPRSGSARPGERARILDRHLNFYQVKTEGGATGWVGIEAFRPLEE